MNLRKKIILGLLVIIVFHEAIAKGKQIDMDSTSVKFEWNFYSSPFTKSGMTPKRTIKLTRWPNLSLNSLMIHFL